jgi:hypothetical protein
MSRMCQHVVAALNRRFKDVILSEGAGSTVLTRLMHKKNYRTLPPLHPPSHTRMHTQTHIHIHNHTHTHTHLTRCGYDPSSVGSATGRPGVSEIYDALLLWLAACLPLPLVACPLLSMALPSAAALFPFVTSPLPAFFPFPFPFLSTIVAAPLVMPSVSGVTLLIFVHTGLLPPCSFHEARRRREREGRGSCVVCVCLCVCVCVPCLGLQHVDTHMRVWGVWRVCMCV